MPIQAAVSGFSIDHLKMRHNMKLFDLGEIPVTVTPLLHR